MFTPSVHEERRNEGVWVNGLRYLRGGGTHCGVDVTLSNHIVGVIDVHAVEGNVAVGRAVRMQVSVLTELGVVVEEVVIGGTRSWRSQCRTRAS